MFTFVLIELFHDKFLFNPGHGKPSPFWLLLYLADRMQWVKLHEWDFEVVVALFSFLSFFV